MRADGLTGSVISGIRWSAASRLAAQGLSWAIALIVVRLLAPRDYGLATQAGIVVGYLNLIGELGLSAGLIQKRVTDRQTLEKVFAALLVGGVAAFFVLFAAASMVAEFFREPSLTRLVRIAATQFLTLPFAVIPQARLSIALRFRELGLVAIVSNVTGAVATLCLAYKGFGAASLVIGATMIAVSRAVALNAFDGFVALPSFRWNDLAPLFGISGTVLLDRTFWYAYVQADSTLIGRMLGARSLGIYSIAMQLTSIPLERASQVISTVALPAFSSINDRPEMVAAGYMKAFRLGSALSFPIYWGLALVAPDLILPAFGSRWATVIPILQILSFSMPLKALGPIASPALTAIGRPGISVRILLWGLCVLPVMIAVGTHWGIAGAAVGWTCAAPIIFLIAAYYVSSTLKIPIRSMVRALRAPALSAACMSVVVAGSQIMLRSLTAVPRLALCTAIGAISYVVIFRLIGPSQSLEVLQFARNLMPGTRRRAAADIQELPTIAHSTNPEHGSTDPRT